MSARRVVTLAFGIVLFVAVACGPGGTAAPGASPQAPAAAPAERAAPKAAGPALGDPAGPAPAQLTKISVSFGATSACFAPGYVADKGGFFKAEGLDPETSHVTSRAVVGALVSGEVDYAFTGGVRASIQGFPIKTIAYQNASPCQRFVAKSDIRSPADLKGRIFAIQTIGGSEHVMSMKWLESVGFNPADTNFLMVGDVPTRVQAVVTGNVDATVVAPEHVALAQQLGLSVIGSAEKVPLPGAALITTDDKLRDKPEEVNKVLRALIRAQQFMHKNKERTVEVIAEALGIEKEAASVTYDQSTGFWSKNGYAASDQAVENELKANLEGLQVDRAWKVEDVSDFKPLLVVQRELGLR